MVRNIYSMVMYFRLTASYDRMKVVEPLRLYADETKQNKPVIYQLETEKVGSYLNLKQSQCYGKTNAYFGFRELSQHYSNIKWRLVGEDDMGKAFLIQKKGVVYVKFEDATTQPENRESLGFEEKVPGIFTFETQLADSYISNPENGYIIEPPSKEITIAANSNPEAKLVQLDIKDMHNLIETHNIIVNYTLYLSTNQNMTRFMSECDNFDVDYASKLYSKPLYYTFSQAKYYGKTYSGNVVSTSDLVKFEVKTLTFGQQLYGRVVAKVSIAEASDTRTFPKTHNFRVFYDEVSFKSSDYTWPLVFIGSLLVIVLLICGCTYFVKRGIWDEIVNSGLMRGFFSEFDQEEIGRKLEIDMMNQYGGGYRGGVFDTTMDSTVTAETLSEDSDPDEEEVDKKIDELIDGKEVELM